MKRSKKLWFITIFFCWAALKSGGSLCGFDSTTDYNLLNSIELGWLFFVATVPMAILEAGTAVLLIIRKPIAYTLGVLSAMFECLNGVFVTAISVANIDIVKQIYMARRQARGMSENVEANAFIFSEAGLIITLLAYIAFYVVVYFVLKKTKQELSQ